MIRLTPAAVRRAIVQLARTLLADLSDPTSASTGQLSTAVETRTLLMSLRDSALNFAALWHLVMVLTSFTTLGREGTLLAVALTLTGAGALLARRRPHLDPLIVTAMAGTGLWGYLASAELDSALVFAAAWQINVTTCLAGILLLRRYGVPYTAGIMVALVTITALSVPEWGAGTFVSILGTQLSIIIAVRWGVSRLVAFASDADAIATRETTAVQLARVAESARMQFAEDSRVLHDTAINTLGAIANGSPGGVDQWRVREQCHRDVAQLDALRSRTGLTTAAHLAEIFHQHWFPVRRHGVSDAELDRCTRLLTASTVTAILRITREAVTNAAKHSGADHAEIEVHTSEGSLTVTISDSGRGFDPSAATSGRGLDGSILSRARDHGFHAAVDSRTDVGTRVTVTVPLREQSASPGRADDEPAADDNDDNDDDASRVPGLHLYHRSSELWAIGVTGVSVVLTAAGGTNDHLALFPMIAVMALASIAYSLVPGFRHHPSAGVLLATATAAVFLLSAAAVQFGSNGPIHWQALAPTGPFILLLATTQRTGARAAAVLPWLTAVLGAALVGWNISPTAGQIVLIAGTVGVGFCALWTALQRFLARLGRETARAEQDTHDALLRTELVEVAQKGRQRWMDAGLDSAISLLDDIGRGVRDPGEPTTRDQCGIEERYLRQLVQISPDLVHLSRVLPVTLAYARAQDVAYHLLLGDADTKDEETASAIASYIRDNLTNLDPGNELRVSLFTVGDALQLTLVGDMLEPPPEERFADATHAHLGSVELVEMTVNERGLSPTASLSTTTGSGRGEGTL